MSKILCKDTGFKIPYLLHNIMYGAILFKILNLLTFCEPLSTALTFTLLLSEILHTSDEPLIYAGVIKIIVFPLS